MAERGKHILYCSPFLLSEKIFCAVLAVIVEWRCISGERHRILMDVVLTLC